MKRYRIFATVVSILVIVCVIASIGLAIAGGILQSQGLLWTGLFGFIIVPMFGWVMLWFIPKEEPADEEEETEAEKE